MVPIEVLHVRVPFLLPFYKTVYALFHFFHQPLSFCLQLQVALEASPWLPRLEAGLSRWHLQIGNGLVMPLLWSIDLQVFWLLNKFWVLQDRPFLIMLVANALLLG